MINFNVPPFSGKEIDYIQTAIKNQKICGDGLFTKKCSEWIEKRFLTKKALLTTSCTHALEMTALLSGIKEGDEVIMPSYTFVSTANAFALRGARIKFVDIRPDTMNLDETLIEEAITPRTKAIVPVHYAGVGCEMDTINAIGHERGLMVIEDAAQAVMSTYKGKALGAVGDFGCYSFHETKNFSMGEGGALLIKDAEKIIQSEILREKGTNRSAFYRGQVDKYTWMDLGSSYLPSDLNAAYLFAQLEVADKITSFRLSLWERYNKNLKSLEEMERIELPKIPDYCKHNAHMFYIKARNLEERSDLIEALKKKNIMSVFHYIPLHSSPAGKKYGEFVRKDKHTTRESERLLRLPLYNTLSIEEVDYISEAIQQYYAKR